MARSASAIQTELDLWYSTRTAIAAGKSVAANGVSIQYQDLKEVNATIARLERELAGANAIAAGRRPGMQFSPTKLGGMGY